MGITQKINPANRTNQIGVVITRGNTVTPGTEFGEFAKLLHIGGAGDVYVRNADGDIIPFLDMSDDTWIPVLCDRVESSGTTATNITWYGGI